MLWLWPVLLVLLVVVGIETPYGVVIQFTFTARGVPRFESVAIVANISVRPFVSNKLETVRIAYSFREERRRPAKRGFWQ